MAHCLSDFSFWLAAISQSAISPAKFRQGLSFFPDLPTLFKAAESELKHAGFTAKEIKLIKDIDWKIIDSELQQHEKTGAQVITIQDPDYPRLLKEIHDAPLLLFYRGKRELLAKPQVAMVGTRNPTITGYETAQQFARHLTAAGLTITSGMALGIDAASHSGALSSGSTIAVMGTGFKHIYPAAHAKLAEDIIDKGLLLSEFSPSEPPKAKNFPLRNRIISGLSMGVLVVEAALRSGSLITARTATEQGRDVFAIPGSIHNPLARGCHHLIRQGAKLVETAEDILEELSVLLDLFPSSQSSQLPLKLEEIIDSERLEAGCRRNARDGVLGASSQYSPPASKRELSPHPHDLLEKIGYETTSMDTIIIRSGLTPAEVSSILLSLELKGYVKTVQGGYIRIWEKI